MLFWVRFIFIFFFELCGMVINGNDDNIVLSYIVKRERKVFVVIIIFLDVIVELK